MPVQPPPYKVEFEFNKAAIPTGVYVGIETPKFRDQVSSLVIEIAGWIAQSRNCELPPPSSIAIYANGEEWLSAPIELARPDVGPGLKSKYGEDITTNLNGFSFLLPVHLSMVPSATYKLVVVHGPVRDPAYAVAEISFTPIDPDGPGWQLSDPIQPVLINSIGRSGSSLLCRMLAANRHCYVSRSMNQFGELQVLDFVSRVIAVLSSQGSSAELNRPESRPDFYSVPAPTFCSPVLRQLNTGEEFETDLSAPLTRQAAQFARGVLLEHVGQIRRRNDDVKFLVEKTWNSFNVNHIRLLFGATKEVFVVRDPKAFWASQLAFHKKSLTNAAAVHVHNEATADRLLRLARAWRDRYMESYLVRYEELISQPRETLKGIFSYLGRAPEEEFLDTAVAMVGDRSEHAEMLRTTRREQDAAEFDAYLSTLNEDTRRAIVRDAQQWGYDIS
jgi:hypothetical protein